MLQTTGGGLEAARQANAVNICKKLADRPHFGDHVAKFGAFPVAAAQDALWDWRLDPHRNEDGFRDAVVAFIAGQGTAFDLRAQLWTDAETQPIEDASVAWPETESPYRRS